MDNADKNKPTKWKEAPLKTKVILIGLSSFMVLGLILVFKK